MPLATLRLAILLACLVPVAAQQPEIRGRTANPHGPLKMACENCHATSSWKVLRARMEFDHARDTRYPLRGMHQSVECRSCHLNMNFAQVSTKCSTCHADFHRRQMGTNCEQCHTVRGWKVAAANIQDHRNRFPLIGAHAVANCESCHKGAATGIYTGLTTECAACHLQDYRQAANFDHAGAGVPTTCETCHSMDSWAGAKFDHDRFARFPLAGMHARLECSSCHKSRQFKSVAADCFGCHASAFAATTNPSHVAAGFPRECAACHSVDRWSGARFDHNSATRFALTGAHTKAACSACHAGGRFAGTPASCYGCHIGQFEAVRNPDHQRSQFSTSCESCHTTERWPGAKYDHNLSRFPLTGAHTRTTCQQCHVSNRYTGIAQECYGCHQKDFDRTSAPNHSAAGFGRTCTSCHTTAQWIGAKFDHSTTRFQLTGKHTTVACQQCHLESKFAGTGQDCAGCHLNEFNRTTDPNHRGAGFPTDCTTCHNTSGWKGARFDHNTSTRFQLTGKHTTALCQQCHVNNQFAGTASDCAGCHIGEFNRTASPNHKAAGFATNCTACHTTAQWGGAKFDHNTATKFQLTGKHTTVACQQCHANDRFAGSPTDCAGCHIASFNSATNPNHKAAGFPTNCATCHNTAQWSGARFDHNTATKFPLTGKHTTVACRQCHANDRFAGSPTDCAGCHIANFNTTTNPNHRAAGFSTYCASCHTTTQWGGAKFDHAQTRFALTGKHTTVACQQCHVGGKYAGTATDCAGCHIASFNATTNPNHQAAGFPTTCTTCHNTAQWSGARFDHNTTTRFALTGKHTTVACQQCHIGGKYAGTASDCAGCHVANFNATTNPNHKAAGFSTNCSTCHNTAQWSGARFDHAQTRFALTGKHTTVACQQCHVGGKYAGTATDCAGCHLASFNATTNPNHKAAGFPTTCTSCHTTAQWSGARFDHNSATRFPLTGKHTTVACQQCHVGGKYAGTATDCAGCHLASFNATTSPNHKAAGFPTTCSTCHTTSQWSGARFDHNTATRFALTGKHTTVACQSCHIGGQYAGISSQCSSCHLKNFNATTSPNHSAAGFSTNCAQCHTTAQWSGAKFDHSASTRFPLTGKHTTVACAQCHVGGKYAGTATDCAGCHLANFNATTSPNHKAAGFPTACTTCHTTAQWLGAKFDHTAATSFPLTGKHTAVLCQQCHVGGKFAGTPKDCAACHITTFNLTTSPNHKAAGLPTDCALCHTTAGWPGAKFDHTRTAFPLTGRHVTASCQQCHLNNKYAGLGTACVNCHLTSFNQAASPNHVTAGFPKECQTCHNTSGWRPATFNHNNTRFPLTGAHVTKATCAGCHVGGKYAGTPMDCYSCHTKEYNTVTNPNHLSAGFPKNCESCHTTATWSGAKFTHRFPIYTGAHAGKWTTCNDCHNNSSNYAVFNCLGCHEHDKARMDSKHKDRSGYVYNSANCYACHPQGKS